MSEVQKLPGFTTIQYVTKDGEKCTATKNNGVVTVQGDKNGVRQVPVDDFMKELVATLPKVDLEKTPKKDTVNFSGSEISDDDKSLRNKYLKIGAGVVAALGAATTLFFVGKGKWWMKAAKNVETKGEELVTDAAQGLRGQSGKAGEKAEQAAEETLEHAAPKVEPPVTEAKPKVETNPKPEEVVVQKQEVPAIKIENGKLPDDIVTDVEQVRKMGEVYNGGTQVAIKDANGHVVRDYTLSIDGKEITSITDLSNGEKIREITFINGKPSTIAVKTEDGIWRGYSLSGETAEIVAKPKVEPPAIETKPKVESPAADAKPKVEINPKQEEVAVPKDKKVVKPNEVVIPEVNTQTVQDAATDDAIIASAALDHAIASTAKKTGSTVDEAVGRIVENGNRGVTGQLAHGTETATTGEQAARELFSGDGVKTADEMFAQTRTADEMFSPHSDIINEPHVDVLHTPNAHADVINEPHIDVLQTPHVDEPVAGFNGTSPENYFAETSFRRGYDELDEIRLGENDEILPDMISRQDPFTDPLAPIGDSSYHLDEGGFSSPSIDDFVV